MRFKKYKQSLRPFGLKRKFFRKIPYVILVLLLVSGSAAAAFFASRYILSKQGIFISPLAQKAQDGNDLQNILNKNNVVFSKIEIATDSSYLIFLKDQGVVNLDSKKNISSQISSLQLILSRLTIEGKKFKRLDLRFDKPIIEF